MNAIKERTLLTREEEQEKRFSNYQQDKENFQISTLTDDNRLRVDNLITNGVYFVTSEGEKTICNCPDFENRCSTFNPALKCKHILAVENWKKRKAEKTMKQDHKFTPQQYLIKVNGKEYLEVKYRIHWFRLEHASWDIKTEVVKLDTDKGIAVIRADIFDEKGNHKSSGLSMEYRSNFEDYLQKAETSCTGRALASLGYGTLQTFDLEEGIEKGRIVDAPVSLGNNGNGKNGNGKTDIKPKIENIGGNGNNGNNKKVTSGQIRYLEDLCKDLRVTPGIDLMALSKDKASELISGLELARINRKNGDGKK